MKKISVMMVFVLTVLMISAAGVSYAATSPNELYVSTRGNDANDGSLAHPFATIDKASSVATPGTVVHVAPGSYGKVRTTASGTAEDRIVYISDVKWGAKIEPTNAWSSWLNTGDYVDIIGFDVTGTGFIGIHSDASYVRIIGNHVHDIANTGDPGGSGGAGIDHTNYSGVGNEITGNVVHDIGPKVENQRIHGIYISNTYGIIKNNIAYNCSGWGIHLYHACSHDTIESNLVFGNLAGGIIISNGSAQGVINDYTVVSNNIVMYNQGLPAIIEGNGYTGPNNRYVDNILYGNNNNTIQLYLGTQEGTIYSDPKFVDFQLDGTGDYHFQSDSPAVPQSSYYDADADYGYYKVWNSSADWGTAAHNLGTGNSGEIAAEFDLTILDASVNGLIGYSGSSPSVETEADIPVIISLDNTAGYFKVRNGDIYESSVQVNYTEDTQYHFKVIPDFTAKTYDVYVTPEGGAETVIAEDYAFQGALEMDGFEWCILKSDNDSASRIENHVLETTALPPDEDDDNEYVITGEKWLSTQAFDASIHNLGQGNTGIVTMSFDFITSDSTQNFGLGYADSSTVINGWAKMSMIITNEFDAGVPYFIVRNGGDYACIEQVPIIDGKTYHLRIVANLDATTYSVYVTPEGGSETAIAVDYAFRTGAPQMDDIGQLSLTSDFDGTYAVGDYYVFQWSSTQAFDASIHDLGQENTGNVTMSFDFMTTDNTQSFGLGYADSSTVINGWAKMSMIITNEFDADLPYFIVRNGGDYVCTEQVSIENGKTYHLRIAANLDAKTYSVYVTPEGGSETAIAVDYAFRTGAPQMDSVGQLSFTSDFDGVCLIGNHLPRAGQTQNSTGIYYVSNEGSDSNDGSQEHPFATIDKAASVATPGTVVHVAPGTYGRVITQVDGTENARIVFVSDTKWGAKIITAGAWQSWFNHGDYVDIIGFEISGDGFIGIRNEGSNVRVIGNNVHNIGNTGDSLGNGGAGILHTDAQQHDNDTIGNVVYDIGPAGEDQSIHGIYHGVNGGHIYNNIVYGSSGWGIHIWQAATDVAVDRNLIFENRAGGIIVGNSKGGTNDNTIVSHNIFMNNLHMPAILEDSSHTGTHNRYINNILYGNEDNSLLLRNGIVDEGTIYSDPQFVNYQPDGSGDYHFLPDSPAVPQEAYYNTDFDYEAWLSAGGKYTAVKTKLTDAIAIAQAQKDNAVVGTAPLKPGEVLQSDLDALIAAIAAAQLVVDNEEATIAEVNDAITVLNYAVSTFDSAVEDVPVLIIAVTGNKDDYILNEAATIDWTVDDGADGSLVDGETAGTLTLDTSTVGIHSVTITAADLAGNTTSKEIIYNVKYVYSGLLKPIDAGGSNVFKQGCTIPLKLWLKDTEGVSIADAEVKLYISHIVDGVAGAESEVVSSTPSSSGNVFRYDNTDEQYIFNYGTKLLSPGLYQLRVDLGDTTVNTVDILIK